MRSRREFLQMGLAVSAVPFAGTVFPTGLSGWTGDATPLYAAVFDERFAASRAFAGEARRLGLPTRGITGDVTALWYHDLDRRWKQGLVAIAGLTYATELFCLDILARAHQMRVVFRAEHRYRADARLEHVLAGPASVLHAAVDVGNRGADWSRQFAQLVTRVPRERVPATQLTLVTPVAKPAADPDTLVSWVIAPRPV